MISSQMMNGESTIAGHPYAMVCAHAGVHPWDIKTSANQNTPKNHRTPIARYGARPNATRTSCLVKSATLVPARPYQRHIGVQRTTLPATGVSRNRG